MRYSSRWLVAALVVAGLGLAGCAQASEAETARHEPAEIEAVAGSELSRLTLEERAIKRLGITTAQVQNVAGARGRPQQTVVPYSAVLYDPAGGTWVYTNPEPRVFVREAITVDAIRGNRALLSKGPAAGTAVVTVGAAELFGAELGVDH